MSDLNENIKKIIDDLTNLEINTIIKPSMTAGKMPPARHALIMLAQEYGKKLDEIEKRPAIKSKRDIEKFRIEKGAYNFQTCLFSAEAGSQEVSRHDYAGSYNHFRYLRRFANALLEDLNPVEYPGRDGDIVMLCRIRENSDLIKGVFNSLRSRIDLTRSNPNRVDKNTRQWLEKAAQNVGHYRQTQFIEKSDLGYVEKDFKVDIWDNNYTREEIEREHPPFPLTTDDVVMIRKAWEIGTEVVVMQTVIQLDGDVITRINPEYAVAEQKYLQTIHNDNVAISLKAWGQLIGLVKDFFESIIKYFAPGKR
jgi:hypothetical protein